jgi:hypothetical protein
VPESTIVEDRRHQETEASTEAGRPEVPTGAHSTFLVLAQQLDSLVAELAAVQGLSDDLASKASQTGRHAETDTGENNDTGTSQAEAVLARLYPIELTILTTPAQTIADLGVKARHAAYVMSEYWEAPINQLDWDARTARLLIEAVCNFAGTPLPFKDSRKKVDF